jgi:hypothetical protein
VTPGFTLQRTGVRYPDFDSAQTAAADGDVILVEPTSYDITGYGSWWAVTKRLTIKSAVPGQRYTRRNTTATCQSGFVNSSGNLRIEDCYLIGTRAEYDNTASIHDDHYYSDALATGANPYTLYLKNCKFEEWPNGVMTSTYGNCALTFENCEFYNNGTNDGYTHDIYHSGYGTGSILVKGCRFTQDYVGPGPDEANKAARGHKIKSNAKKTEVYGCLIDQGVARNSDIVGSETGGEVIIKGNLIRKSANSDNAYRVGRYGGTGFDNINCSVAAVSGNTITTDMPHGGSNGTRMDFNGGTPPSPLALSTTYYLRDVTTSSFSVAATPGGAAIILTSATTGAACRVARPIPAGYVWAYTFEQNTLVQNCVGFGTVLVQTDSVSASLATFTVKDNIIAGEIGDHASYDASNSMVALASLVGTDTYDKWRLDPPVPGSGGYATVAYAAPIGTIPRADTYRGGQIVIEVPSWAKALPASSITTVSLNNSADVAPAGLKSEFDGMSRSYSGTTFSKWYGTHGGIIAKGGGGYTADKFVAAVWDVGTRLWSALWAENPPLTEADGSEVSLDVGAMPSYATAFDNTGSGMRYYKPQGTSVWSDPLLWFYRPARPFVYGETSTNIPMAAHEYDCGVAIRPGSLGTGAYGGLLLGMRTFATRNQGLCSLYPHVLDLSVAAANSANRMAWQRLAEIPVPSGGNTGENKLFQNSVSGMSADYNQERDMVLLTVAGGSGRATCAISLAQETGGASYSVLGDDAGPDSIPNGIGRMLGATDTRIFLVGNGPSCDVSGIDMDPATPSSQRRVKLITAFSGTGPVCGATDGFMGLPFTWVEGYSSGGRKGAFAVFTADPSGMWPKALFWLVPPTDRATGDTGQWLWDSENLTGDAPLSVASEAWGRFDWADAAKVGLWCGDDRTGVQAIKSSRVV